MLFRSAQRARYARRCAEALDQLARSADAAGDTQASIGWKRRAQEIDPLDAGTALSHADALLRSGDRPSALRALRFHAERVREELAVEPDASVRALETRLAKEGV